MTRELNPQLTFDTLITGAGNRLAVTAARTVAESPGTAYNPLFIYSETGLGKTHLLMAIGQMATELTPTVHVEYLTMDEFAEEYHAAVAAGQTEAIRNRFETVDVLLVDDVQFLSHRREMQTELLRLTSQLQTAEKQVVLTSDRPPSEIEDLDSKLIARFDSGLVVDIAEPDYETRLAILLRRAQGHDMPFGEGVLEAAAAIEVDNVRELLGLLNRLVAFQAVSDEPLTPEGATEVLAGETRAQGVLSDASGTEPGTASDLDEFADFLTDVSQTVHEQVNAWESRLGEAIMRWEGEGFRTARLEELLKQKVPGPAEQAISGFERDVELLRSLRTSMLAVDPERVHDPVFFDPDRVEEAEALVEEVTRDVAPLPGPSAAWSLDAFVAGEANKVARSAAEAVVEAPGTRYNPLVLVGPTGVGKTHLLHGIGHALSAQADAVVACQPAQDFVDELVHAIDVDKVGAWRSRYERVSALLLDDVHLLARKERSQEELFHLFNTLFGLHRQLVFTLNASPKEVEGLDDRIMSRLEGGLLTQLGPPDRDLRRAIVARKLEERLGHVDGELADYLAARAADSIRAVIGLVQRVLGAAEAQSLPPTAGLAREVVEGTTPAKPRTSGAVRTSGIMVSPVGGIQSREKVVWYWPDPVDRMIQDIA